MLVSELISELQYMPQDMEVCFTYLYGDRVNTIVARQIDGVDTESITYSSYHNSTIVCTDEYDFNNKDCREAVVINS
jgi:hypothetical protein